MRFHFERIAHIHHLRRITEGSERWVQSVHSSRACNRTSGRVVDAWKRTKERNSLTIRTATITTAAVPTSASGEVTSANHLTAPFNPVRNAASIRMQLKERIASTICF